MPKPRMRSPVRLVRSLSLIFKNLQERSAQLWSSNRSRLARNWVVNRLKEADSRIREVRLARPGVFGTIVFGIIPVAIVVAILISGSAAMLWTAYHANREDIVPVATFVGAAVVAYAALRQAATARQRAATATNRHLAQTKADRQRRIVESFSKAVEQLGSDKLEVRVGGIFALERLSNESPNDYWTVMELLAGFVRDRMKYTAITDRLRRRAESLWKQSGRPEGRSEEFWLRAIRLEGLERTPTDVAAILTVIRRRSQRNRQREVDHGWRLDLSGTYLREAFLINIDLRKADLRDVHFEKATLSGAHLERARLRRAHLEGARLGGARLKRAELVDAHLEKAKLRGAHLERARLGRACLKGADLRNAHLEGADLQWAEGIRDDQILLAFGDGKTKLPERITRPNHWPTT